MSCEGMGATGKISNSVHSHRDTHHVYNIISIKGKGGMGATEDKVRDKLSSIFFNIGKWGDI